MLYLFFRTTNGLDGSGFAQSARQFKFNLNFKSKCYIFFFRTTNGLDGSAFAQSAKQFIFNLNFKSKCYLFFLVPLMVLMEVPLRKVQGQQIKNEMKARAAS